jgi:hypothetical protein
MKLPTGGTVATVRWRNLIKARWTPSLMSLKPGPPARILSILLMKTLSPSGDIQVAVGFTDQSD